MASDPTVQTMWARRYRCRADRSSPRRAGNRSRKSGSRVHCEVWRPSDADAGGSGKSSRTRRVSHYQLRLKPSCSCRGLLPCRSPPPPSTPHEPELKILRAGSFGCMWFSTLVKSKYIAPADSTAAETHCNRRSKRKPCICSGLSAALIRRNYEFVDDSWEIRRACDCIWVWLTVEKSRYHK